MSTSCGHTSLQTFAEVVTIQKSGSFGILAHSRRKDFFSDSIELWFVEQAFCSKSDQFEKSIGFRSGKFGRPQSFVPNVNCDFSKIPLLTLLNEPLPSPVEESTDLVWMFLGPRDQYNWFDEKIFALRMEQNLEKTTFVHRQQFPQAFRGMCCSRWWAFRKQLKVTLFSFFLAF